MSPVPQHPPTDPVLARRSRAAKLARRGQRLGYVLFAVAIVVFSWGLLTDFTSTIASIVVGILVAGSVVLAPAIITGYAVKAAVRDDIEHGRDPG